MRILFLLFLGLIYQYTLAQSFLSQTSFDLGEITQLNEDIVDLKINNLAADNFLLRVEGNRNITYKFTNKNIKSGETVTFRFKLNPKSKGRLKEVIKLYFSQQAEPIELTFHAKVIEVVKNNLHACPSFNGKELSLNENGVFNPPAIIKSYQVTLSEQKPINTISEVSEPENKSISEVNNNTIPRKPREKREPKVNERRNQPSLGQILFGKQKDEEVEIKKETDADSIQETIATINDSLLNDSYKPNNIVFLIDASTSMREDDKMDLLKSAMIELLRPLRSIDYLSIVTYSGESTVILNPTSGVNKLEIQSIIENIKADGSTQAVKGIKKALQVAKSNFLNDGNNQIILASDGAFDIGERNESLRKKIKKEAEGGIVVSVIGIKNENWTNKSLKEIAELGKGSLIRINKTNDTKKVLEEVKSNSIY